MQPDLFLFGVTQWQQANAIVELGSAADLRINPDKRACIEWFGHFLGGPLTGN